MKSIDVISKRTGSPKRRQTLSRTAVSYTHLDVYKRQGVEITTSDAEALEGYIRSKAKEVLDNGVTIKEVAGKAANFDISPEGADYKINVSKEAFTKYFTEFMRPRMREILFGGEKNA